MDEITARINAVLAESEASGQRRDLEINKEWVCERGHVLGFSVRVRLETEINGQQVVHYVDRLLKLRHAVDIKSESPADIEVDCEIEGTAYNIQCDVPGCSSRRTWHIGEAALERFLAQRGVK